MVMQSAGNGEDFIKSGLWRCLDLDHIVDGQDRSQFRFLHRERSTSVKAEADSVIIKEEECEVVIKTEDVDIPPKAEGVKAEADSVIIKEEVVIKTEDVDIPPKAEGAEQTPAIMGQNGMIDVCVAHENLVGHCLKCESMAGGGPTEEAAVRSEDVSRHKGVANSVKDGQASGMYPMRVTSAVH